MDDTKNDNPAYITMVYLNSALWELDSLYKENLKVKD